MSREARLGTLKVSGLYHKKVKFSLKISDRALWLEVQVLKSHRDKSRRRNDKGPQDMEIDCIKNVTTDLSAKACQTRPRPRSQVFQILMLMLRYLQFHMFLVKRM